jgi:hypothetical protein
VLVCGFGEGGRGKRTRFGIGELRIAGGRSFLW